MESVSILGLGTWGTALAEHLARKGTDVIGWTVVAEIAEGINSGHRNPLYLNQAALNHRLRATLSLEEALSRSVLVLAFPSAVLSEVVPKLMVQPGTLVISAIKGMEPRTLMTPLVYAAAHMPAGAELAVLSGPSFARDVAAGLPCGIVAASRSRETARRAADLFASETMRVYMSLDPLGVEIGGVVKNVIAIAAGVCDGMGLGDSARAGLITRGLAEMMRLSAAIGADVKTLSGLSGLGDLVMTATCDTSRNRTVGLRLGRGEKLGDIIRSLGSIAEGVDTTRLVLELARRHKIDVPVTEQVDRLLKGETTPADVVTALFARPMKMEF